MGLLSFLKRRPKDAAPHHHQAASAASDVGDSVQQARTRARQRLIGAVVLVTAGVIGFSLLFESQPRPLSVNTPIEIARRDGDSTTGAAASSSSRAPARSAASRVAPDAEEGPIISENAADAGRELPPLTPAGSDGPSSSADAGQATPPPPPPPKPAASRPAAASPEKKPDAPSASAERQRAEALLSGQDPAARKAATAAAATPSAPQGEGARYVVQVGAFGDMAAAREARHKVEKLGIKTFTQVIETSSGKRIRVRLGPFSSRAEAEKAAAKVKSSAGLASAVFTL